MNKKLLLAAVLATALLIPGTPPAQAATPFQLQQFATGLSSPVDIRNNGVDSRLFVVQQGGQIVIRNANGTSGGTFMNISSKVVTGGGEEGLLGLVFDPDYATNHYFYVYYTVTGTTNNRLSRFTASDADTGDPNSELIILNIAHPGQTNHNGGGLQFGNDGMLYVSTGDGGGGGDPDDNGQDTNSLLGKILRLDVSNAAIGDPYDIPAGNPFVGQAGKKQEIWDYGLRNPWRFSFDRTTHRMIIADVGQGAREEVDVEAAGSGGHNYGWNCYEGAIPYTSPGPSCPASHGLPVNYVAPVNDYDHSLGCSITGGYLYRGSAYPVLAGKYVFTDYCSGRFFLLAQSGGSWTREQVLDQGSGWSTFGEALNGELYVATLGGTIYQVQAPSPYLAEYVGQTNAGTLPAGQQATVSVDFRNVGTQTWSSNGSNPVRLGTSQARDRSSPFYQGGSWISPMRVKLTTNQTDADKNVGGETTVAPGEVGRFTFVVTAPPAGSVKTYREHFALVAEGVTWFGENIGQYFSIPVTMREYSLAYGGQTNPPTVMTPGQRVALTLDIVNDGDASWHKAGLYPFHMVTSHPLARASAFANNTWLNTSRLPNYTGAETVAAAGTAHFSFDFVAPSRGGLYTEYFQGAIENFAFLPDLGVYFQTFVNTPFTPTGSTPNYAYQYAGQSPNVRVAHNGTATVKIRLKNIGKQTWNSTGANAFRLGTSQPRDRASGFAGASGWIGNNRVHLTRNLSDGSKNVGGETTVLPGQVGEFEFVLTANPVAGRYAEHFAPVVTGMGWLRDIGIYIGVTVT